MHFKKLLSVAVVVMVFMLTALSIPSDALQSTRDSLKVGFIYVGPVGDFGWTHAHNEGRLIAEQTFPWLETFIDESVEESEGAQAIDRMIQEHDVDVVFTTSFGYIFDTAAKAEQYPDVLFFHASGFLRAPNMGTYMADFHQVYFLNGLMAGALTETDKLGYVGAHPIPEVKRHINAFALGARMANPDVTVDVRWINEWVDPIAAQEAAEALISDGVDVLAFTEDTPTVLQVAESNGIMGFSHYSPMHEFAPNATVSGQLVHWEVIYLDILAKVFTGVYTANNLENVDYWYLLQQGAVELGGEFGVPINPIYEDALKAYAVDHYQLGEMSAYDLVFELLAQASDPEVTFSPFTGPIFDRNGVLRVADGVRLGLGALTSMEWAAEGVIGAWHNEPAE